jgi:hypothetical protein
MTAGAKCGVRLQSVYAWNESCIIVDRRAAPSVILRQHGVSLIKVTGLKRCIDLLYSNVRVAALSALSTHLVVSFGGYVRTRARHRVDRHRRGGRREQLRD